MGFSLMVQILVTDGINSNLILGRFMPKKQLFTNVQKRENVLELVTHINESPRLT